VAVQPKVKRRSPIVRAAYRFFRTATPKFPGFEEVYLQSGVKIAYEAYLATTFFVSVLVIPPLYFGSFLLETRFHVALVPAILASAILAITGFSISLFAFLLYPYYLRNTAGSKIDGQLPYSLGFIGILSAAGTTMEGLLEKLSESETNKALSNLANRFLQDINVFGLDTESALAEVAKHSPSKVFAKFLQSAMVAFKTSGSLIELIEFESKRLLQQKRDELRRVVHNLSAFSEVYIALVVVGPIIFIILISILSLLTTQGIGIPSTVLMNLIVFIGVPVMSVFFLVMLDSQVNKA
jgi:archaellum biogenesis protein FlaJ (TadC family)